MAALFVLDVQRDLILFNRTKTYLDWRGDMNRVPTKWPELAKLAIGYLIAFPTFYSVVNFLHAEPPPGRDGTIPATWSAGVMNHGRYFEWYAIYDHPFWFAGSVLGLAASAALVLSVFRKANSE